MYDGKKLTLGNDICARTFFFPKKRMEGATHKSAQQLWEKALIDKFMRNHNSSRHL